MEQKILFVGAHPDDVEFGCGGTIAKHLENNDEVFVLVMTNGEKGHHPENGEECLNSLHILGVKRENIIFGCFKDGYLNDSQETINFIETIINRLKIGKVYTHDPNDRHQDHRYCSNAVSSAARKVAEILLFQGPSTNVSFEPHYFVRLKEEHIHKKKEILNCYKSQFNKNPTLFLKWAENVAVTNGLICNSDYAEGFSINHIFKGDRDV